MEYANGYRITFTGLICIVLMLAGCNLDLGSEVENRTPSEPAPSEPEPEPSEPEPTDTSLPELLIHEPFEFAVASPLLDVHVECESSSGACEIEVRRDQSSLAPIASSTDGVLNETIDLSDHDQGRAELVFVVTDAAGQQVKTTRHVYVEPATMLTRVATVPGIIQDADQDNILYTDVDDGGSENFFIYSRNDGSITKVTFVEELEPVSDRPAYLTPTGAIFLLQEKNGDSDSIRLYDWSDGELKAIARPLFLETITVAGKYVAWADWQEVWRWDSEAREKTLIAKGRFNQGGLLVDGSVVYTGIDDEEVYFFSSGSNQQITSEGGLKFRAKTDGDNFIYYAWDNEKPSWAARQLYDGAEETQLGGVDWEQSEDWGFFVNNGWVAFSDHDENFTRQAMLRTQAGNTVQLSEYLSSIDAIEALGSDGSVMVLHSNSRRLLTPNNQDELVTRNAPSGAHTFVREISGEWHVAVGNALFKAEL